MADGENLSPEQTESLLQFQDLTGIDDIDRCKQILTGHNWNMEAAVQDTFNEREGAPSVFSQPQRELRPPAMNLQPSDQRIFAAERLQPVGLLQWGYFIVMFPFRFVYTSVFDLLRFVYRLIWPDPRRNVTDPLGDVLRFITQFEENYGQIHPVFYQGTYSQALNDAKRELRFLLVYLHSKDHQETPHFCRGTLCSPQVVDFFNSRLMFWACDTTSPEGFRVSQALRENTYPFLALIVLRDNKMTVVARIEGAVGPQDLLLQLERVMEDNEASLIAARAEREERNFTQTLRQQQDEAYEASLRADQEKERRRREEQEREAQELQKIRDEEERKQRLLEERELRKDHLRASIPEEPPIGHTDAIRILLKLPTGTRLERRFYKNQSIKYLYYYVFCHPECPDDFQIVTNFPRRTLDCEPTDCVPEPPTFEEIGLGKSEMLFVHDNEA